MKLRTVLLCLLVVMVFLAGCSNSNNNNNASNSTGSTNQGSTNTPADKSDGPKDLVIAFETKPPTLDPHMSTAAATREVSRPIFEGLVALDSKYIVQPMLADSWKLSEDGKTITFTLRQGVKFHNDKEMTSEDVIASLTRWMGLSTAAKANFAGAELVAVDPYTVDLKMASPSSTALSVLAGPTQYAAIMPKEVIESAAASGVTEYIGTGVYKVSEFVQDQYLKLARFDSYQAVDQPTDGLAGKKEALVDTLTYEFVTDASTRQSGLQTGQYDIATTLSFDNYDMLNSDPSISSLSVPDDFGTIVFNKQEGVLSNVLMRQAILAALDMDKILISVNSNPFFYELDHGLASKEQVEWYSDAGKELYNQKNVDKAKELMAQAGYNNEEIHFMTTRDLPGLYYASIAIQQQLKDIGMNVVLDVYDWSALLEQRKDASLWGAFFTSWPTEPIPSNYVFLHSANGYAGWSNSPEIDALVDGIKVAGDQAEASKLFAELQQEFYEYVPAIKYGVSKKFTATRSEVTNVNYFYGLIPWGINK